MRIAWALATFGMVNSRTPFFSVAFTLPSTNTPKSVH